jgi:hypothetical protein
MIWHGVEVAAQMVRLDGAAGLETAKMGKE